jgi:hypothetical protein
VRSDIELLYFLSVGIIMLVELMVVALLLYFSYFRMDEIVSGFSRNRFFLSRRIFNGRDPCSRFFLMIGVGVTLLSSSRALKSGELDYEDYKEFSARLRRKTQFIYLVGLVDGFFLFSMTGLGKWVGWVR